MKTPKCYTWLESCGSHLSGGIKEKIFFSILQSVRFSRTLRTDIFLYTEKLSYLCCFLMPGCNKLYKCGSQKISKQSTFVAGRLKTAVLLQKPWFTAFLSRMSRKTQHTRFEDKILRKLANEDKPQVVTPWVRPWQMVSRKLVNSLRLPRWHIQFIHVPSLVLMLGNVKRIASLVLAEVDPLSQWELNLEIRLAWATW
jgi:hypothetical protein